MNNQSHSKNGWNKEFLTVGYEWEDIEKMEEVIQGYYSLFYEYAPPTKHIVDGTEFYTHDREDLSLLKGAFNSAIRRYFKEY